MPTYTKTYKDLLIWQRSHELAKKVIRLIKTIKRDTASVIIINQLIRSITSTPANIVEGYYTRRGKQFASYLERARGSLAESDYWLLLSTELNYIDSKEYKDLTKEINEIILMISSLAKKVF